MIVNVNKLTIKETTKEKDVYDDYTLVLPIPPEDTNISREFVTYRGYQRYEFHLHRKLSEESASNLRLKKMPGFKISWGYNVNQTQKPRFLEETGTKHLHRLGRLHD